MDTTTNDLGYACYRPTWEGFMSSREIQEKIIRHKIRLAMDNIIIQYITSEYWDEGD